MQVIELNGELVLIAVVNHEVENLPVDQCVNHMVSARIGESVGQFMGTDLQLAMDWALQKLSSMVTVDPGVNRPNGIGLEVAQGAKRLPIQRMVVVVSSTYGDLLEIDWNRAFHAVLQDFKNGVQEPIMVEPAPV